MHAFSSTSCIILSAGSSERMGMHKALLPFDGKSTFLQHLAETYANAGIETVIAVVSDGLAKEIQQRQIAFAGNTRLVINHRPDLGRFYSLQCGISNISPGEYCFFQNIDNPFTTAELLMQLAAFKQQAGVIIPAFQNKTGHPVLISPDVVRDISSENTSALRIDDFLQRFTIKRVEIPDELMLSNINSMEEYRRMFPRQRQA